METKKNIIKFEEIEKEKFVDKIYNNKFFLTTIMLSATIILIIIVASLFVAFFWK